MDTTRLKGKVAIVTGASSGIGAATVERFVGEGAKVIAAGRSGKQFELEMKYPGSVVAVTCEVADEGQVAAMVTTCIDKWSRVDVLVNNAGIVGNAGRIHEYDPKEWDRVQNTNVRGPFLCMKHAIPHMLKQGGGSIVNVGSVASFIHAPGSSAYPPSKGALLMLTRQAASQYFRDNIRVNICCPGPVETPILDGAPVGLDTLALSVPIGRLGRPEEVAALIAYLASDEAAFCTGASFLIDGGLTI
jgi:NAD(P)-dependent dehydrogenase (short-subunit alcohol dehydrogenase family)